MGLAVTLRQATREAEQQQFQIEQDPNRLWLHLMPPVGWMNDPNGLCQFQGTYHVFFQYSPLDPNGSMKAWGHYASKDLIHWEQLEAPLFPDEKFDQDGVYSGSAFIENDQMHLFYTGNVKQQGNHDYTYTGREANTVLVTSQDGIHFNRKQLVMTNADYPAAYSCHIRDPKVWKENERYYMIQGGRKKKYPEEFAGKNLELTDFGTVLIFQSEDLVHWTFQRDITTRQRFGYMWECPDYFKLKGRSILSVSPQGLDSQEYRYQNVYQSGYFLLNQEVVSQENVEVVPEPEQFHEWDMGFDFYAPQTFLDEKGRRILIGWAGIPDAEYDNKPTVEAGWQHALTLLRELTWENGKVLQNPVEEYKSLRGTELPVNGNFNAVSPVFEMEINNILADFRLIIGTNDQGFTLHYEFGVMRFSITREAGRGRTCRKARIEELRDIRIFVDTSLVEIYINGGETVFTSRFYFPDERREILIQGARDAKLWYLGGLEVIKQ